MPPPLTRALPARALRRPEVHKALCGLFPTRMLSWRSARGGRSLSAPHTCGRIPASSALSALGQVARPLTHGPRLVLVLQAVGVPPPTPAGGFPRARHSTGRPGSRATSRARGYPRTQWHRRHAASLLPRTHRVVPGSCPSSGPGVPLPSLAGMFRVEAQQCWASTSAPPPAGSTSPNVTSPHLTKLP